MACAREAPERQFKNQRSHDSVAIFFRREKALNPVVRVTCLKKLKTLAMHRVTSVTQRDGKHERASYKEIPSSAEG